MRYETDPTRKEQAAQEAVELLDQAGFVVNGYNSTADARNPTFELDLRLSIGENERPLEALD